MGTLYNRFTNMPKIPYEIIKTLALSKNENLWKVLYYDEYDCLSKPNLTFKQKMSLIWKDEANEEDFKIFLKPLIANELVNTTTQLRINRIHTMPKDRLQAVALYEFAIITGYKTAMIKLDDIPVPRIDYLEQQLLEELNGVTLDLAGTTILQYNRENDNYSQSNLSISNSKSFFGSTMVMGIGIIDLKENSCG